MKKYKIITLLFALSCTVLFSSCEDEEGENETKISRFSDTESHNLGQNCMNCHVSGGGGEGWFTAAGSLYNEAKLNPYPNATIDLYTEKNASGDLVKSIQVDGRGNFYTTEIIDFGSGLYPTVTGTSGDIQHMDTPVSAGQCNSCHGVSTDKMWVK